MARITIDNTGNMWPGKTSIADIAQFTPLLQLSSHDLDIYMVEQAMGEAWPFEIEAWEYEFLSGYSATFKDGSKISIGAWADRDDEAATRVYRTWKSGENRHQNAA